MSEFPIYQDGIALYECNFNDNPDCETCSNTTCHVNGGNGCCAKGESCAECQYDATHHAPRQSTDNDVPF